MITYVIIYSVRLLHKTAEVLSVWIDKYYVFLLLFLITNQKLNVSHQKFQEKNYGNPF